jgi:hypothetical protein
MSKQRDAERRLEDLLEKATKEPAFRPEFYQRLMEADVYVVSGDEGAKREGTVDMKEGDTVNLVQFPREDGSTALPFFTSLEVLQKSIDYKVNYICLPARILFEMTEGTPLILNPFSEFGKDFTPEEVHGLLTGELPGGHAEKKMIEKETKILMGQPKNYPAKLVESLTTLFAAEPAIKKAYLAQMYNPSEPDVKPHLVIGLYMEPRTGFEASLKKIGPVANASMPDGDLVDFILIEPDAESSSGIAGYMLKDTRPFYEARWSDGINMFADRKGTKN